jgi:ABC-type transporter Mla subunit MlaD
MSWWNTGEGDDVIGDQLADQVRNTLQHIAEARTRRSQEKPTLADLLNAIAVVGRTASKMFADSPSNLQQIVAQLKSGDTIASTASSDEAVSSDLSEPLIYNLRQIDQIYEERWERKPRFAEWLRGLEFVLRYRPEDFLRDGATHHLRRLEAR